MNYGIYIVIGWAVFIVLWLFGPVGDYDMGLIIIGGATVLWAGGEISKCGERRKG